MQTASSTEFLQRIQALLSKHKQLIQRPNAPQAESNGVYTRYQNPILTAAHTPVFWRYDLNPDINPHLMERQGVNAAFNAGALYHEGKYLLVVRVEGVDRKSFFCHRRKPERHRPVSVLGSSGRVARNG